MRVFAQKKPARAAQPKLAIGRPGSAFEREADRVAARVVRMPAAPEGRCPCGGGCPNCRAGSGDVEQAEAPPAVHEALGWPGAPLDAATRTYFEPRFGQDFGAVRVHTGSRAAASAAALHALAYTAGRNIVFAAGQYAPQTGAGRQLLAHELAHVLQQQGERPVIQRKIEWQTPTYARVNPISRVFSSPDVGNTRPTVNGNPLPDSFNDAGDLVFQALEPKQSTYNPEKKECTFKDFDVGVSANVIVPTEPEEGRWTGNVPGASVTGLPDCRGKRSVPVVMTGRPRSEAVLRWVESNEQEHVDDLRSLHNQYLKAHFDWLLGLKAQGDDSDKCQKSLLGALGDKGAIAVRDFLNGWLASIRRRDARGGHNLKNRITSRDRCARVEIESSTS